jgi:hypothetical protein
MESARSEEASSAGTATDRRSFSATTSRQVSSHAKNGRFAPWLRSRTKRVALGELVRAGFAGTSWSRPVTDGQQLL